MKIRKITLLVIGVLGSVLLFCLRIGIVNAATGNITVKLPEDVDTKILYLKVATMYNGEWELDENFKMCPVDLNKIESSEQLADVAKELKAYAYKKQISLTESKGKDGKSNVYLTGLEEGLYLVIMEENEGVTMSPGLIALPGWGEKEMSYEVTMVPKMAEKNSSPKTGWNSGEELYVCTSVIAIVLVLSWFYYKRTDYSK